MPGSLQLFVAPWLNADLGVIVRMFFAMIYLPAADWRTLLVGRVAYEDVGIDPIIGVWRSTCCQRHLQRRPWSFPRLSPAPAPGFDDAAPCRCSKES